MNAKHCFARGWIYVAVGYSWYDVNNIHCCKNVFSSPEYDPSSPPYGEEMKNDDPNSSSYDPESPPYHTMFGERPNSPE